MQRFLLDRFVQSIVVLFCVGVIAFSMARLSGDASLMFSSMEATEADLQRWREASGLSAPLHEQFYNYFSNILRGDFGVSYKYQRPILPMMMERLGNTVQLVVVALTWASIVGISMGVFSARYRDRWVDKIAKIFTLIGQASPAFWLGIMLILFFSVVLGWLPSSGMKGPLSFLMPATVMGAWSCAAFTRLTRSSMIDVLDSEYIKMARAKGVRMRSAVWKHGLRNALLPVITLFAMLSAMLLYMAVVVETVFAWPGLGRLAVDAFLMRDYPMVQGVLILGAACFLFANLMADIVYCYLDPRIRYN